jgi:olefin beta-lactone synthetase
MCHEMKATTSKASMNLASMLSRQAEQHPDRTAIVDRRGEITFGELDLGVRRAAAWLDQSGLRPGDRVLVLLPMSRELYLALIAIFRLGLVATFVDVTAGRDHVKAGCAWARPQALIGGWKAHLLALTLAPLRQVPVRYFVGGVWPGTRRWEDWRSCCPLDRLHIGSEETPALLTLTSGSTDRPKAALRTHGFLRTQHEVLSRYLEFEADDVDLVTLPMFLLANLGQGITSVIPNADLRFPGRIDPGPVLNQMRIHGVNRLGAAPAFLTRLLEGTRGTDSSFSGLRKVFTGGGPVSPEFLNRIQTLAPRARVRALYGSTEAEPMARLVWDEGTRRELEAPACDRGLLAGVPVEELELRILQDRWGEPIAGLSGRELAERRAAPLEIGEIVVSGPHVLDGYLAGPGDGLTQFEADGRRWHRTGDAGYLDGAGRLWLCGRCAARIEDERGILYPFGVERSAQGVPGVRRAALLGMNGKRVLAVERSGPDRTWDGTELKRTLAWAELDAVAVLKAIPLDHRHNSKVDYPALRKRLRRDFGP